MISVVQAWPGKGAGEEDLGRSSGQGLLFSAME